MPPNDRAWANHIVLFGDHASDLAVTDPELIEVFDNFAFDEVLQHGTLDTDIRLMVQLAGMIAAGALSEYRVLLGAALTVGVTPVQVREIVYQAVPYVGMGRVLDFLHVTNTNEVLTAQGVPLPVPGKATTTPDTRAEHGLAGQKQIVGADAVDTMYAAAPPDLLHIQRFLSANYFGDHVSRGGLDLPTRELLLRHADLPGRLRTTNHRTRRREPAVGNGRAHSSRSPPSCCPTSATPAPSTRCEWSTRTPGGNTEPDEN